MEITPESFRAAPKNTRGIHSRLGDEIRKTQRKVSWVLVLLLLLNWLSFPRHCCWNYCILPSCGPRVAQGNCCWDWLCLQLTRIRRGFLFSEGSLPFPGCVPTNQAITASFIPWSIFSVVSGQTYFGIISHITITLIDILRNYYNSSTTTFITRSHVSDTSQ